MPGINNMDLLKLLLPAIKEQVSEALKGNQGLLD